MANPTSLRGFFAQLNKVEMLDFETLNERLKHFKATGCRRAHDTCVEAFLPLVHKMARQRSGWGDVDDLFQHGALSVMDAIRNFDPEGGLNIVSWTKLYVSRDLNRYCTFETPLIRVPGTKSIRKCYLRMRQLLQTGPITHARSVAAAKDLGVTLEEFLIAKDLYASSYEEIGHTGEERDFMHQLAGEETLEEAVIAEREAEHIVNTVGQLMRVLTPKEAEVIRLRCLQDEPAQLRVVGEQMGVSAERVRQIEAKAKKKMQDAA